VEETTAVADRAAALVEPARAAGRRVLLGITGPPAAGKSSIAAAVAAAVPGAVVVPMDGFHLTTAELQRRGWVEERGTPRTFDAEGYVALLRRVRAGDSVRAPAFDRCVEEPVPDAIVVPRSAPLVITEGNYLLLDVAPWCSIRALLDEVWFVEVPEPVRLERLIARHVEFGRTPAQARERATRGSDAANARLVTSAASRADVVIDTKEWGP
jgi:pantothenate kinase